ncbi:ATP-binding cassette domain-containing protein [Streptosporangium saharense]|uniref:ABC-2 type transport system ATP-binding protein n=1 Tax=Streptosporangium saharense TaxID=1706840 RepID=A0A7W7QU99_9ACTN|nr:ABC transporter ATP-binding protein [Streptosporangium saharense]MBB4919899.1 ABC-2 type transport system ATP-binding protein [Streptosporangium saharense]
MTGLTRDSGTPTDQATGDRLLAVTDLSFAYGDSPPVLTGVTLRLRAGEVLGVLGRNGAGKSTLINAILDIVPGRRGGSVTLGPEGSGDVRRHVGVAGQRVSLYKKLTVAENLTHAARLVLPRRRVAAAAERAVEDFGLARVARTPVHRLSGGWERLSHIAASFVHAPRLRFLDEPTSALDFETRTRLVALMARWRRDGDAMIVTSHYPEDIEETCTHVAVVSGGTVVGVGPLRDLLGGYHSELLARIDGEQGPLTLRAPAPGTVAQAAETFARWAGEGHAASGVESVRLTSRNLREIISLDPELQGSVVEHD